MPSIPELRLHLAGPKSGLGRLLAAEAGSGSPYWAHVWAGGLVLARHLLDRPATVAGRRVFDLGCGSGIVAIAAARSGASAVTAVDVDPWAIAATRLNAGLNGVAVDAVLSDPLGGAAPAADIVLVGDVFYDSALAACVVAFLDRCRAAGAAVLVGDPGRTALPLDRLRPLRQIATPDFASGQGAVPGSVYRYGSA